MPEKKPIGKSETALAPISKPQLPGRYVSADNRFAYLANLKDESGLPASIASELLAPSLLDTSQHSSPEAKEREQLLVTLILSKTENISNTLTAFINQVRDNPSLYRDSGRDNNMFKGLIATITRDEDEALYQSFKMLITIASQEQESQKLHKILDPQRFPFIVPFITQFKDSFEKNARQLNTNEEFVFPPFIQYTLITLKNTLNFPVTAKNKQLIIEANDAFQAIVNEFVFPSYESKYSLDELENIRRLGCTLQMRYRAVADIKFMEPTRIDADIAIIDTLLRLLRNNDKIMQDLGDKQQADKNTPVDIHQLKIAQKKCSLNMDYLVTKLLATYPNLYHYLVQRYGKDIVRVPGIETEQHVLPPNNAIEYMEKSELVHLTDTE